MTALQVRDFPDGLYERLKAYASAQCRSVSQQTVIAVREMLQKANDDDSDASCDVAAGHPHCFDTGVERQERVKRKSALFDDLDALPAFRVPLDFPRPEELVRHGREERDASAYPHCSTVPFKGVVR